MAAKGAGMIHTFEGSCAHAILLRFARAALERDQRDCGEDCDSQAKVGHAHSDGVWSRRERSEEALQKTMEAHSNQASLIRYIEFYGIMLNEERCVNP